MTGIAIKKAQNHLIIKWQLTTATIPIDSIIEVGLNDTYGGTEKQAIRLGTPYGTTDRIVIKTVGDSYLLFTTNYKAILNQLAAYLSELQLDRS